MGLIIILFLTLLARTKPENQTCKVIEKAELMELSRDGDLNIAGVFSITSTRTLVDNDYQAIPYSYCKGLVNAKHANFMLCELLFLRRCDDWVNSQCVCAAPHPVFVDITTES